MGKQPKTKRFWKKENHQQSYWFHLMLLIPANTGALERIHMIRHNRYNFFIFSTLFYSFLWFALVFLLLLNFNGTHLNYYRQEYFHLFDSWMIMIIYRKKTSESKKKKHLKGNKFFDTTSFSFWMFLGSIFFIRFSLFLCVCLLLTTETIVSIALYVELNQNIFWRMIIPCKAPNEKE